MTGFVCPPPPCINFDWLAMTLHVALRPLYELRVPPKTIFAIARSIAIKMYCYPYAEGAICRDGESTICSIYRMFYRCVHEDRKTYAMIEMVDDSEYGLLIHAYIDKEINVKDMEGLQPKRLVLNVDLKEDEEERRCLEEVKKVLSQNE